MALDPQQPDLRASDSDREATVGRLRVAAMEGRLDADELAERISVALNSRWCYELERLTADVTPAPPARPMFLAAPQRTNGLAVASLVGALLWMGWMGSLFAVVAGHVALSQIDRSQGRQGGRGVAISGLVLGYLELISLALIVVVLARFG
jgi:hypothetical protein